MGLRRGSPLACSINMRGGARDGLTKCKPPCETLAAASSQPNSKALAAHVVLAHPPAVFHPCTCGLRGGTVTVDAVLISYNDVEVAIGTTTRWRRP
jgi:hypothetical protein